MKEFTVYQYALRNHLDIKLSFPDDWDVKYHDCKVEDEPVMTREQIKACMENPVGSAPLSELAKGQTEALIVFDDISRGTPVKEMAEAALEILLEAGVPKKGIRFLCALGMHGAHTRLEFAHKLGEDIVAEYPVFNHNCYENLEKIGTTTLGTDVWVNREFTMYKLRIGLGGLVPHPKNGFAGGGKLLFPGLAGIETVDSNHRLAEANYMGECATNPTRREIEEMTAMAGDFFVADAVYNMKLEPVRIFTGEANQVYYEGIPVSRDLYETEKPDAPDVLVINANSKINEAFVAVIQAAQIVKEGGDIVLINYNYYGNVVHYWTNPFGYYTGGRVWEKKPDDYEKHPRMGRLIVLSPYPDATHTLYLDREDKVFWVKTWEEVLNLLSNHKEGTKVSIIPDATIQCYKQTDA